MNTKEENQLIKALKNVQQTPLYNDDNVQYATEYACKTLEQSHMAQELHQDRGIWDQCRIVMIEA